jgi:hypothetical protein
MLIKNRTRRRREFAFQAAEYPRRKIIKSAEKFPFGYVVEQRIKNRHG